jgi:hypothetical protein
MATDILGHDARVKPRIGDHDQENPKGRLTLPISGPLRGGLVARPLLGRAGAVGAPLAVRELAPHTSDFDLRTPHQFKGPSKRRDHRVAPEPRNGRATSPELSAFRFIGLLGGPGLGGDFRCSASGVP